MGGIGNVPMIFETGTGRMQNPDIIEDAVRASNRKSR